MEKNINSMCWNITGKCNENCKFCYRRKCEDNTLDENILIFDNISKVQVGKISFCGGEPLLYEDLFNLVDYIKRKSPEIKLSITTNGMCIDDSTLPLILEYFDWLSLSIDSSKNEINELMGRGYNHLEKVLSILDKCDNLIKLKINTVVNKMNLDDLENIYELISRYNISRWKLFRFFPIRDAIKNRDMFYISDQESKEAFFLARLLDESSPIKIEYNDFEGQHPCFSIQPNGSMENSNNEVIGNLLDDSITKLMDLKVRELTKQSRS